MQAIGFNEHYGLQTAVFERRKTMTRRAEKGFENLEEGNFCFQKDRNQVVLYGEKGTPIEIIKLRYKIGEIVAIKQCYKDIIDQLDNIQRMYVIGFYSGSKAWTNKMFVRPDLMVRHIRIIDTKIERLQSIGDDDCMKEGLIRRDDMINSRMEDVVRYTFENSFVNHVYRTYQTPRDAFAALIDKVSGKGTWNRNQFMSAYTFELID